jgi:hypothetical protein
MRKHILLAGLLVIFVALAGCGSDDGGSQEESTDSADTGVSFQVMEMSPGAQETYGFMADYVDEYYVGWAEEQGDVEGEDYLDVRGLEPEFVGYEIVVWRSASQADYVERLEVPYLNGRITSAYATPDTDATGMPTVSEASVINIEHVDEPQDASEQAAVDAAVAKFAEVAPDFDYEGIGINRYLFLYDKDGVGVVIGLTSDGELGSNSMPFELAE